MNDQATNLKSRPHRTRRYSRGFSLMEIAMALVVVGVGMTAVVGIFPIALEQAAENNQQSRMALFAEEIAQGLQLKVIEEGANLPWNDRRGDFRNMKLDLVGAKLPKTKIWTEDTEDQEVILDGRYHGFLYLANAEDLPNGVDNHDIGYKVLIQLPGNGHGKKAHTYATTREVVIHVYKNNSVRNQDGNRAGDLVYYTEIHKPMGLNDVL